MNVHSPNTNSLPSFLDFTAATTTTTTFNNYVIIRVIVLTCLYLSTLRTFGLLLKLVALSPKNAVISLAWCKIQTKTAITGASITNNAKENT